MHHAWREAPQMGYLPPWEEWAGQTVHPYHSRTITALCCQSLESLGYTRAIVSVCTPHASAYVYKHNLFYFCATAVRAWTSNCIQTKRSNLWQLCQHRATLAQARPSNTGGLHHRPGQCAYEATERAIHMILWWQTSRRTRVQSKLIIIIIIILRKLSFTRESNIEDEKARCSHSKPQPQKAKLFQII